MGVLRPSRPVHLPRDSVRRLWLIVVTLVLSIPGAVRAILRV